MGKKPAFDERRIKRLSEDLQADLGLKERCEAPELSKYAITMDNDYLSSNGHIVKQQHLEADYTRRFDGALSASTASFRYTWRDIAFSSSTPGVEGKPIRWTFADGAEFGYYKSFFRDIYAVPKAGTEDSAHYQVGDWYSSFANVPSVNLLYMLTWDVIMFEELNTVFIDEPFESHGRARAIKALGNTQVQLSFKGCESENSFFKNGEVLASLSGLSLIGDAPAAMFEFRSAGRISVERSSGGARQEGESYFLGKVYVDLSNGDFVSAEMTELLTVSLRNKEGKMIPMQKRRLVQARKIA